MIIVAAVEAAVILAVVYLALRHAAALSAAHAVSDRSWAQERRELLNRIQRPEHVPLQPVAGYQAPEPEVDELEMVGTIHYDEKYEQEG